MQVRNMSEWCVFAHSKAIHGQAHGESSMHSGSLSGDESKGSNSGATALSALGKFVIKHFKNCNDRMDAVAALNRILSYISSHADNQACSQAFMLAGSIATRLNALDVMRSLLYSVAFGRESEKLLKSIREGTDINAKNRMKSTPILIAAGNGHHKAVAALISAKANIKSRDKMHWTALHHAAQSSSKDTVRVLIEAKAEIDADFKDNGKVVCPSPLQLAASDDCKYVFKVMGAGKWTPLMVAAEKGFESIHQYLRLRSCVLCIHQQANFDKWFQDDVRFYSSISRKEVNWAWGPSPKGLFTFASRNSQVTRLPLNSEQPAFVLGSEELALGVHRWEIVLENSDVLWAGLIRGMNLESEDGSLISHPSKCSCQFLLAFCSDGTHEIRNEMKSNALNSSKVRSVRDTSVYLTKSSSKFASGQKLEFLLDMHEHTLSFKVDGQTVARAVDVNDSRIRPFLCFASSGCAKLISQSSDVTMSNTSIVSFRDRLVGLNNKEWPPEVDRELSKLHFAGKMGE